MGMTADPRTALNVAMANAIRKLMADRGWTCFQLGRMIDVTEQHAYKLREGGAWPSPPILHRLRALGISVDGVLDEVPAAVPSHPVSFERPKRPARAPRRADESWRNSSPAA